MKGFIEVTRGENNCKFLIAVEKIIYVEQCESGHAFVMFWNYGYKRNTTNFGITTAEFYSDIVEKIKVATE